MAPHDLAALDSSPIIPEVFSEEKIIKWLWLINDAGKGKWTVDWKCWSNLSSSGEWQASARKNQWCKCKKVLEDLKLENKIFCAKTSIKTKLVELGEKLWVNFDLNWICWCEKFLNFCQSDEAKTFLLLLFVFSSRKSNFNFLLYCAWLSAVSCTTLNCQTCTTENGILNVECLVPNVERLNIEIFCWTFSISECWIIIDRITNH